MIASETRCRRPLTGRTVLICLIAFFAIVAAVNGIMIRAAISTFGGVETGSAFQAGQAFKHDIEAARAQQSRHWQVKANVRRADGGTAGAKSTRATRAANRSPDLRPSRRCIGRRTGAATSPLC